MKCNHCKIDYPDEIVTDVIINGCTTNVCGICALQMINETHGDFRASFTQGSIAEDFRLAAIKHRKKIGAMK